MLCTFKLRVQSNPGLELANAFSVITLGWNFAEETIKQ
jgi:hypothetical protein